MIQVVAALASGTLFGVGLAVSQMVDPAKVLGFLDVAGDWDPSLALVMAGALAVAAPAYRIVVRSPYPVFDSKFLVPPNSSIDIRLVAGAVLFGVGWGLVGLCPGPAIASLAYGMAESVWFLAAMFAGLLAARFLP